MGWSRCFEVDGQSVVAAWDIAVGWVVESRFEEVQGVWCSRVCAELHRLAGIVVAEAQMEVVGCAVDVDAGQQLRRMEQAHCAEEGSLGVRMAVVGIVVLRNDQKRYSNNPYLNRSEVLRH